MVEALDIAAQVFAIVGALKQAYDAYRKVGKAVDEWGSSRQLDCLAVHLDALRQTGDVLTDAAAEGLRTQLRDLRPRVKALLASISILVLKHNHSNPLVHIIAFPDTRAAVKKAKKELRDIVLTLADVTAANTQSRSSVLEYMQPVAVAKCEDLITGLEDEYNRSVCPIMDYLQQQKSAMGERYPEAMFMPPVLTSAADCEKMLSGMRDLWGFWRKVQRLYQEGARPGDDNPIAYFKTNFFTRSWTHRGQEYRMLCEPLDIANWYYRNKQCQSGHYIDKDYGAGPEPIRDELSDDNNKRPGRYLLLQQQEARVLGTAPSSLDKAKELKALIGERLWQHADGALEAQGAADAPALLPQSRCCD